MESKFMRAEEVAEVLDVSVSFAYKVMKQMNDELKAKARYLPCDTPSFSAKDIGIWGQRHLRFIKEHRKAIFANLMSRDVLGDYLTDINTQAEDMFLRLVDQTAEREGVTEQFKADNQIEWVQRMNNIRSRATEIVNSKLIYEQGNHPARKQ